MEINTSLSDLSSMHPRLLWNEIIGAACAVLLDGGSNSTLLETKAANLPEFDDDSMRFTITGNDISATWIARLERTYESSRLIELAAIAVAGLGLYYGGGHEIRDVALRGSGADYLVDHVGHPLEIAGRSRQSDVQAAWNQRWARLSDRLGNGFYVCVAEFETPSGRLAFAPEHLE